VIPTRWFLLLAVRTVLCAGALASGIAIGTSCLRAADDAVSVPVPDFSELEEQAIRAAADRVSPSLLRIEALGGKEDLKSEFAGITATTGVVVDSAGYIVTSSFALHNDPSAVIVIAPDGKRLGAKVVARDEARHLALLKIEPGDLVLTPVHPAPISEIKVGQTAIALGRTLDQGDLHLSAGVVSSLGRVWNRAIQTDAKISPRNYGGALVDLRGRVIGILAPMSPHEEGDTAGVEWYDAGLGFAVPLADVMQRFEKWKNGDDLRIGKLGIGTRRGNAYVLPPRIASCRPGTPSHAVGIRAGDVITAINGQNITQQQEMRHILGREYAGDKVQIAIRRGSENLSFEVELAAELTPWQQPALGLLPARGTEGCVVRHIFADSPAAKAKILPGDVITHFGDREVRSADDIDTALANLAIPATVHIKWTRKGEPHEADVALAAVDSRFDDTIPPAPAPQDEAPAGTPSGLVPLKRDELPNNCQAWVPATYRPNVPHGLLVWVSAGDTKDEDLQKIWDGHCRERQMIVMAVRPAEGRNWQRNEIESVYSLITNAQQRLSIDRRRIAILGEGLTGQMAWAVAGKHRELVRGVASLDFPLSPRVALEAEPLERLEVLVRKVEGNPLLPAIDQTIERLQKASIPVQTLKGGKAGDPLSEADREMISLWFDALDRL
jgi:serine protease Do